VTTEKMLHKCHASSPTYYAALIAHLEDQAPPSRYEERVPMADVRQKRLERYETWAAECQILARAVSDHSKQKHYEHLSAHYSYLAASFREALAMHSAALAKSLH
jgi:hypothetical protein